MAPGSRGAGAVFVCFSGEDSGQTGDAISEPRVPCRSWSRHLSNTPGLVGQLAAIDLALGVRIRRSWYRWKACVTLFFKVPDLQGSELGLVRYGSANRGHRSVFGPFEDSFPIGIPARPGKILAIREFHIVHECVFFPMCLGLWINLLRVRKTLRASVATSVGKFRNFQHSLISSTCFYALHRGELRFARYDLANRGRWNVPYAKGSFSDRDFGLTGRALDDPEVAHQAGLVRAASFCVPTPEKIPWVAQAFQQHQDRRNPTSGATSTTCTKTGRRNKAVLKIPGLFPRRYHACAQSLPDSQRVDPQVRVREKKTHSCTVWNSRIVKIFPGLTKISIEKMSSNEPKTLRRSLFAEPYLANPSSVSRKSKTLRERVAQAFRRYHVSTPAENPT
uniref:Uncharacterized protein n=1 Tax=Fagus sylvatica TaxID=28930 RepID=A0A2N9GBL3_FAGSY